MFAIAVAGSRGRLSIVAAEAVQRRGDTKDLMVVRLATPIPQNATPEDQYAAVMAAETDVKSENDAHEPRLIVAYGGQGSTLYEYLREDYRQERRIWRPAALTHAQTSNDGRAYHIPMNRLAARLAVEWKERRIAFAPDLKRLRDQVASFAPIETKAGNLQLADEADAYDGMVVALMYALALRGKGVRRFQDASGKVWPSYEVARQHIGSAAQEAGARQVANSFGVVRTGPMG
jgi:hypothetical protein